MTAQTFGAAGEAPGNLPFASGRSRIRDGEGIIGALGGNQFGVGLRRVPTISVGVPCLSFEMHQLGFDEPLRGRHATLRLQKKCPGEHCVGRKIPHPTGDRLAPSRGDDRFISRDADPTLCRGVIAPHFRIDLVRHHAGGWLERRDIRPQTGFTELAGKNKIRRRRCARGELINAAVVIQNEQFAGGVFSERHGF